MNRKHGLKIKHKLEDNGSSFAAVARSMEYPKPTPQAVRQVAFLVRKSQRIISQLSKYTGWPESEIWPDAKPEEEAV